MAQTWPVTRRKRIALGVADFIARGASLLPRLIWRPRRDDGSEIKKILVMELWLIGDVVLVTPLLQALRVRFPRAHIAILAKRHAEELLRHSGLVDEFITFDFPWTAKEGKYRPGRYNRHEILALMRRLRGERFDLTIDCRMDIRSNVIAFATGAPRRVGYDFGGGAYLLTDALPASPDANHKVDDWLALLDGVPEPRGTGAESAGGSLPRLVPQLVVTDDERAAARARLRSMGFGDDDTIVGIHPGASEPRRRWPLTDFAWVADSLLDEQPGKALVMLDPANFGENIRLRSETRFVSTTLREMMAMLTQCDVVICNDSGPMHIADALGVPVVAVFTTGNPDWHRPYGDDQIAVGRGTGHDFISYPTCEAVLAAAKEQLSRVLQRRSLQSRAGSDQLAINARSLSSGA